MSEASPEIGDEQQHENEESATTPDRTETDGAQDTPSSAKDEDGAKHATETQQEAGTGEEDGDAGGDEDEDKDEDEDDEAEDEDEDEDDDEDEEPRLKYARLTQHLGAVYRNGDATSAFLVAGDKMVVGTHNGNIHVIQLPIFQTIRVYHAHSASVTAVSISPYPPPLPTLKPEQLSKIVAQSAGSPLRPGSRQSDSSPAAASRRPKEPPQIPNIPSNNIYIATSSVDGNVCVQSLIDMRDVQLRNFARPVQAVALSPDYKNDRTYLSGGLAGNLVLTVGGQPGRSTSTTIGTAAATASGWLGSMGLGTSSGRDSVLYDGEGTISTIKWSLSGKYVVWLNEHGIKIMRTKLHLEAADADDAWKRFGHIPRPESDEWDTMAGVWKGRVEWIDEQAVDADDDVKEHESPTPSSLAADKLREQQVKNSKKIEKLIVGWGGTIWIINIYPGGVGVGKNVGEKSVGRAEIVKLLRMDCIISGISLYTQSLLLVLAYCLPDEEEEEEEAEERTPRGHKSRPSIASSSSEPSGGIRRRQNNLPPELRLIDLTSQVEVDKDTLSVSRFERLSSNDYHLGVLPARTAAAAVSSKGALEALAGFGTDVWNVAINPKMLFSSGASTKSRDSNDGASGSKVASSTGSLKPGHKPVTQSVDPSLAKPGIKIFIHSPYDCILATKRDLADHLSWLLEHKEYQKAWELVDENPEVVSTTEKSLPEVPPSTPDKTQTTLSSEDFYEESVVDAASRAFNSSAEREKRRIGELWIKQLVEASDWVRAGQVAGKVLRSSDRWEKWVWAFAGANKFDEITNYIPTEPMHPPIPRPIYEVVLGHYIKTDKLRFRELLERWSTDLFDIKAITTALEIQLSYRDVREDSIEDGEKGRDWRIVMESLAKLHEANGRHREALKCYIRLQDADSAFRLIRDSHLAEVVMDDIPSFIALRVPAGQIDNMAIPELEEATSEAITLLVDEAQHGLVKPELVISQLEQKELHLFSFFYLRGLWNGEGIQGHQGESRDRVVLESKALLDAFADLAVHLFALFDRPLLMDFLKFSTEYSFDKAALECETYNYIDELVYLYSKTGQMKRALYLIIDRLGDVSRAIAFAKEQNDPDLWEDLLNYSMDKPRFIRGLLEEVGTAIDPITLVRRIPEGLEVEGLREGLKHIMKEHEIQYSISSGVARVLRSEVAAAQATLRNGQRKGIKFEVVIQDAHHVDVETQDVTTKPVQGGGSSTTDKGAATEEGQTAKGSGADIDGSGGTVNKTQQHQPRPAKKWRPGHCASCLDAFTEWDTDTLVGFVCGHVFHLNHLLELLHAGEPIDLGFGMDSENRTRRNIIGTKVTHARLLKDRITGGCPVCKKKEALL